MLEFVCLQTGMNQQRDLKLSVIESKILKKVERRRTLPYFGEEMVFEPRQWDAVAMNL